MHRLAGLDVLRAIAIGWVMLFHSWVVGGLGLHYDWLRRDGWMAVDLFFVLSGYLIGRQLLIRLAQGLPLNLLGFYRRRALRIMPAYAVVLLLYFALPGFDREGGLAPWWEFVSYTLNLLIDYAKQPSFSHAWSLCVEEHFYLLFPLLAWLLTRHGSRYAVLACAAGLLLGGIGLRWLLWQHSADRYLEVIYYPTYNRLDGLLAGVLLATVEVYRPALWATLGRYANSLMLPLGAALLALAILVCQHQTSALASVLGFPLLAMAMAAWVMVGASPSGLLRWLAFAGVRWLASISYSLYLIHKAVFKQVQAVLPRGLADQPLLSFMIYAGATLLAGAALHYLVERPALRWRDRKPRIRSAITTEAGH